MNRSSRRLAVLAAAVAVFAGACTNGDVDGADAAGVLEDAGAPRAARTCVGDRFDEELEQDQLNDVGGADRLSDLPNELEQTVQSIVDECVGGGGEGTDEQELTGADAASALADAGVSEAARTCVGDRFDEELDQDELNQVAEVDELTALPAELEQTVQQIVDDCLASEDATETTEADGDTTTTTAAG